MSDISDAESSNRDGEGCSWYRSRRSIEENSPSRRDGIDLEKEIYLRASYSDFLQNLGMRLKVPQFTIATAIVFCHRFFLRQSHAKNDRWTIATACMFLAGKVEETQQPLEDVILASYGILHEKDPEAEQRINKREVLEQQEKLILLGERLVLKTLDYDLCVCHPYKPLVEAIKKFEVGEALVQVAWNFVNDGLRTSMCLQYEPYLIAAGAIFLAAKFLKVKLPSDGERKWWQELNVTTRQLEEVSNQILELYEQARRIAASNEVEGSEASGDADRMPEKATANNEEPASEQNVEVQLQENQPRETLHQEKMEEAQSASEVGLERSGEEGQEDNGKFNATEAEEEKDKQYVQSDSQKLGDGST